MPTHGDWVLLGEFIGVVMRSQLRVIADEAAGQW
jgi:hypothetical protein